MCACARAHGCARPRACTEGAGLGSLGTHTKPLSAHGKQAISGLGTGLGTGLILIGPQMLGLIRDSADTQALAEFGVVFLMFSIGLEFSLPKLNALRRAVFG